jgi:hypothetical protein
MAGRETEPPPASNDASNALPRVLRLRHCSVPADQALMKRVLEEQAVAQALPAPSWTEYLPAPRPHGRGVGTWHRSPAALPGGGARPRCC